MDVTDVDSNLNVKMSSPDDLSMKMSLKILVIGIQAVALSSNSVPG